MIRKLYLLICAMLCTTIHIQAGPAATGAGTAVYYGQKAACERQKGKVFSNGRCYKKSDKKGLCNSQPYKVWQNGKCYSIKNGKIGPQKPIATAPSTTEESLSAVGSMTQTIDPAYLQGFAFGEPNPSAPTDSEMPSIDFNNN